MTWKHDLKLRDVEPEMRFEITCECCRRIEEVMQPAMLEKHPEFYDLYLDEVESRLRCTAFGHCGGTVRLSQTFEHKMEGWVGGMA